MIPQLTDEQKLLAESVARFTRDGAERLQPRTVSAQSVAAAWRQMAELGWLGVRIPEAHGGIGGGPVEVAILMESLGRGLVRVPYLSSAVIGSGLVARFGTSAQKSALLPDLASGAKRVAAAFTEFAGRYGLHDIETVATADGSGYVLNGGKSMVIDGAGADTVIVLARTSGAARDRAGLSLFLVPAVAKGVTMRDQRTYDGGNAADVTLTNVHVPAVAMLGGRDEAADAVEWAVDHAIAALCAEAVGVMSGAFEMTLDHLKSRRQFGRAIGGFQALQHRMADLFAAVEETRSLAFAAAWALQEHGSTQRIVAAAKIHVGRAGRLVADECIQMHGAIGMTDEYAIGHYAKRLLAIDTLFGDADHHLGRFTLGLEETSIDSGGEQCFSS
jgi:alkylation response protein AidB-like acyl-CoA dehydrogenase